MIHEELLRQTILNAVLHGEIVSALPSGETRTTPFWMGMWMARRSQEERGWHHHQHDNQTAWNAWLRRREEEECRIT